MNKKAIFLFGAAAVCLSAVVTSVTFILSQDGGQREVPEFSMPSASETSETSGLSQAEHITQEIRTEESSGVTAAQTSEPRAAEAEPDFPEEPQKQENVLVTSADPLHYVRFEFSAEEVRFSGKYEGAAVEEVRLLNPRRSAVPDYSGGEFRGSLDLSGLSRDHYVLCVLLDNGAGMYYVFEVTEDGAGTVPAERLPAADNLAAIGSPFELPEDGVMTYITSSGDRDRARELLQQVRELSDEICAGIVSDYDKLRAITEWVGLNMYYDKDASESGDIDEVVTLEYVLEYHRSVCFGWANLFTALCQAQGIECYNASGSVVTGSRCFLQTSPEDERSHSWNLAVIDGRQIWVDSVWNSTNSFENGKYKAGKLDLQYFDIDGTLLSYDHRVKRFEHRDYFALG